MIRELPITEFDLQQPAIIWDVRDQQAYAEGHVQGASHQPLESLTPEVLAAVPAGQTVYVLCGGGSKAPRAAALLDSFEPQRDIVILAGGTRKARAAGLPIETGLPQ